MVIGPALLRAKRRRAASDGETDVENGDIKELSDTNGASSTGTSLPSELSRENPTIAEDGAAPDHAAEDNDVVSSGALNSADSPDKQGPHIAFAQSADKSAHPKNDAPLYVPGPRERDRGEVTTSWNYRLRANQK